MKIEWFCVIKDNIILEVYHTADGIAGVEISTKVDYDEIKKMPDNFEGHPGLNLQELDGSKVKPIEQRILEGLRPVPKGYKIKNNKLIAIEEPKNPVSSEEDYNLLILNTLRTIAEERLELDKGETEESEWNKKLEDFLIEMAKERIEMKNEAGFLASVR